ncbi:MAG: CDP-diacylglycerol--serine O-phosphatidyltransferase [Rikenellaceae bacterium]|jgi:CDP-diacylglycerol--serine O-phosphatidyltransferase|nr:CDP-diacylglycerol--serine O-phosphatidyltransferase [Rikenellaceae bacterium]
MKIRLFTIPNVITLLNLLAGCLAVVAALDHNPPEAFWWIAFAAVCDFLDGFTARTLRSYSEVGKQLDSLADMVSFGVAPAMILFAMLQDFPDLPGGVACVAFLVALFSALRLAKFNIDTRQGDEFIGFPTPANALLIASVGFVAVRGSDPWIGALAHDAIGLAALAVSLSLLLVSEIRMFSFKFKNFSLKDNALRYAFLLYAVVLLAWLQVNALPWIIITYIILSTVIDLFGRLFCSRNKTW